MFDLRLKGGHLADYMQIVCAEQMDSGYVLGETEGGDGLDQRKKFTLKSRLGESVNISVVLRERTDNTVSIPGNNII